MKISILNLKFCMIEITSPSQHRQTANCGKLIYDNVDLHFTNHEKPGWWPIIDDYIAFACELTVAAAESISFGFNVKKLSYEAEAKREPIAGKTKCYTYGPKFILLSNNLSPNIVHLISTKMKNCTVQLKKRLALSLKLNINIEATETESRKWRPDVMFFHVIDQEPLWFLLNKITICNLRHDSD